MVVKVPEVFYNVDPAYFKTVKKAGGAPAAPTTPGEARDPAQGQNHRRPANRPAGPGSPGAGVRPFRQPRTAGNPRRAAQGDVIAAVMGNR